jgi:hypothetical protein
MITVELKDEEYNGLVEFLKNREGDIQDDHEDLGLLLPLLNAYKTRVLWTAIK